MYPTNISRRALTTLLVLCAAIILLLSLEVLFFVKDTDHYEDFQRHVPEATFSDYLNARLFSYIVSLVPVLSLALYTFFLAQRFGTPPLYRLIWGLLLGAATVLRAVQTSLRMPLSLVLLTLYIACTLVVINIHRFSESR